MMGAYYSQESSPMLQQTLAAGSSPSALIGPAFAGPHHPITCQGDLRFEEDNTFSCPHAVAPPDDPRTQHCLDSSVAFLLIELAIKTL